MTKKFIVEFEGEEDYTPPRAGGGRVGGDDPAAFIYWDSHEKAITTCAKVAGAGHRCWMAKVVGPHDRIYFTTVVPEDSIESRTHNSTITEILVKIYNVGSFVAFKPSDVTIIYMNEFLSGYARKPVNIEDPWVNQARDSLVRREFIPISIRAWGDGFGVLMRSWDGRKEWVVFRNLEEARDATVAKMSRSIQNEPTEWDEDFLLRFINADKFAEYARSDADVACETFGDISQWIPEGYDDADAEHRQEMINDATDACIQSYVDDAMMAGIRQYFIAREGRNHWLREAIQRLGMDYEAAAQATVSPVERFHDCIAEIKEYLGFEGEFGELENYAVSFEVM